LDLTLIFASANGAPKPAEAAHVPFTPAAWVMSGLSGGAAPTASAMANLALPKGISEDQTGHENASPMGEVDGIQAEITPGAPRSSQSITPGPNNLTKGVEPGLSTAERSELHQAQAEKMGQAIGQRMISEMEKGHWHLKMMLKPANLGNVEVEMRMRNGELDANFTASQAVTRDLLQDGLPKLRDTLTQMGMDVASMNIGGGSSQKNGGEPTPQQAHNSTSAPPAKPQEEQVAGQSPQVSSSATDGLDVLV
jgi:flagellar hook-length control protein FliK